MKVVHFGDVHVWHRDIVWQELGCPKRWLGPLNLALRRARKFPPAYRKGLVEAILAEAPDLVICTGDFTTFSLRSEFEEAAALFQPLVDAMGDRFFAIPGNHDCYTARSVRQGLLETLLPWVKTGLVNHLDLPDNRVLVSVDHAVPLKFRSNGVVTPESQAVLRAEMTRQRDAGKQVLLVGHFPYACPPEHPETVEHRLLGENDLASLVAEFAPLAYLHGHKHVRWVLRPESTPDTLCLNCGSACMKHGNPAKQAGFLTFEWGDNGVSDVTAVRRDGDGWVRE